MKKQKKREVRSSNGITLIALVVSIIVMMVLAGVSINATIGDNGIIRKTKQASIQMGMAVLEEFLQQYYIEHYDEFNKTPNKAEALANYYDSSNWFYKTATGYIIDGNGKKHYFLVVENLPEEIKGSVIGGLSTNKTIGDYIKGNDVYGVTADLKVYYSLKNFENLLGNVEYSDLEEENNNKEIFSESDAWSKLVLEEGEESKSITLQDIKKITTLTIDEKSGINSLSQLYNFTSLKYLTIKNINISLKGIENVPDLIYLELDNTNASDYNSISKLKKLQYLYMHRSGNTEEADNSQVDGLLSAMAGVDYPNLTYFGIYGYSLVNINYELEKSYNNNIISNVSNVSKLSNLSSITKKAIKYLYLNNNKISDLSMLSDFTQIISLRIEMNPIVNLNFISNIKTLNYLRAMDCALTDIAALNSEFTKLCFVDLRNNNLLDNIDNISEINSVEYLYLSGCRNLTNETVTNISDYYNSRVDKNIDGKYNDYLMGSTKRVYVNKNLTDTSSEIIAMENMSAENKKKIKKISLKGNNMLSDTKLNTLLSSGFTEVVALDLRDCSLLTNLDFLANMTKLSELLINNTNVTGDEVKEIDDHCTRITCVEINTAVNLTKMQKTISNCRCINTDAEWKENFFSGFKISSNLVPQLANCTEITYITSYGMATYLDKVIDLSGCTKITKVSLVDNGTKFKLPSTVSYVSNQNSQIPDFSNCINKIQTLTFNMLQDYTQENDFVTMCNQLKNSTSLNNIYLTPNCDFDFSSLNLLSNSSINEIKIVRNALYSNIFNHGLKLNFNKGEDYIEGQKHFDNLQKIHLEYVVIKDLNFIKDCTNLTDLTITQSSIEDISGLENLNKLISINLSNNKITSLNGLQNKNLLNTLYLNNNSVYNSIYDNKIGGYINNVEILKKLNEKSLRNLYLKDNKIDDFSVLNTLILTNKEW